MIQVNRIYLIFNRLVTKKFLVDTSGKRYIISYSLDQLEGMLDRDVFFRVSRSCISNIRSIRKSSRYFGSRLKLYFEPECPHEVLVSRSRVADFLKWVDGVV